MYVDKSTAHANGKTYTRYLLRESKREGKTTIKNHHPQHHTLGRASLRNHSFCARQRATRLKIAEWIDCDLTLREIILRVNESKLKEISMLDGCYCLTTNLSVTEMDKESVHSRYKDLAMVESAFRTFKTRQLEVRPIYLRKAGRTRAHVMLSYLFVLELRECWREVDGTVEETLATLGGLCGVRMGARGGQEIYMIPRPRPELSRFFDLADIQPPSILPAGRTLADTKRKLKIRRKLK